MGLLWGLGVGLLLYFLVLPQEHLPRLFAIPGALVAAIVAYIWFLPDAGTPSSPFPSGSSDSDHIDLGPPWGSP